MSDNKIITYENKVLSTDSKIFSAAAGGGGVETCTLTVNVSYGGGAPDDWRLTACNEQGIFNITSPGNYTVNKNSFIISDKLTSADGDRCSGSIYQVPSTLYCPYSQYSSWYIAFYITGDGTITIMLV